MISSICCEPSWNGRLYDYVYSERRNLSNRNDKRKLICKNKEKQLHLTGLLIKFILPG